MFIVQVFITEAKVVQANENDRAIVHFTTVHAVENDGLRTKPF